MSDRTPVDTSSPLARLEYDRPPAPRRLGAILKLGASLAVVHFLVVGYFLSPGPQLPWDPRLLRVLAVVLIMAASPAYPVLVYFGFEFGPLWVWIVGLGLSSCIWGIAAATALIMCRRPK